MGRAYHIPVKRTLGLQEAPSIIVAVVLWRDELGYDLRSQIAPGTQPEDVPNIAKFSGNVPTARGESILPNCRTMCLAQSNSHMCRRTVEGLA